MLSVGRYAPASIGNRYVCDDMSLIVVVQSVVPAALAKMMLMLMQNRSIA